tara:strand:+ start:342 stop:584 length:243 start_codon:yes stop_codon:yes gene_type:complete
MNTLAPVLTAALLFTTPAISSADFLMGDDPLVGTPQLMLAGSINPSWGSGAGFHYVQPSNGNGYWRSNPDGQCWNNKYGC